MQLKTVRGIRKLTGTFVWRKFSQQKLLPVNMFVYINSYFYGFISEKLNKGIHCMGPEARSPCLPRGFWYIHLQTPPNTSQKENKSAHKCPSRKHSLIGLSYVFF